MVLVRRRTQLVDELQSTVKNDEDTINALTASLDPLLPGSGALTEQEIEDVLAFLFALTSPSIDTLTTLAPDEVPSGLPVDSLERKGGRRPVPSFHQSQHHRGQRRVVGTAQCEFAG